jgi:hypothetical protein
MAWTAPITFVNGVALTAAQLNAMQANILETAAAKATTASQYFAATGANALAARIAVSDVIDAIVNITSTTYIASTGPSVSVVHGAQALVSIFSTLRNNTTAEYALMSYEWVAGAFAQLPNDNKAIGTVRTGTTDVTVECGAVILTTGMTPGTSTCRAMYKVTNAASTGVFDHRRIAVMPF